VLYSLIAAFFGKALDLFYRRRSLANPLPTEGPVLVVANHPNGLIDPIMLMRISRRPLRFLSKAPLFKLPIIGWLLRSLQALPVFRAMDGVSTSGNTSTFSAVTAALQSGQAVCLFPEGISHDLPELQPLKTGAARMAFDAEVQADFKLGLKIIPVGLHYRRKTRFRSEAATQVGEPVLMTDELRELYAQDEREAVRLLTARIDEAIRLVTVNLDRWDDLPLLEMASQIWTDENDVLFTGCPIYWSVGFQLAAK
jgi:glycerol-3-phosphate O-acyltransferase/dihydroxyacetone phosphate acyltransferase